MDKGKSTCAVFLDLSKAFDTVDHKILLRKLMYYGIRGKQNSFFESYLTNRKQCTKVNNYSSVGQVFATFATFFYSFQQLPKYARYI